MEKFKNKYNKLKKNKFFKVGMTILYPLISISLILLIWFLIAKGYDKTLVFPPPKTVFQKLGIILKDKQTYIAFGWTTLRVLECFLISGVLALVLSLIGAFFEPFHKIISPFVTILRTAPTLVVMTLIVVWSRIKYAPIIVGFFIAFPLLYSAFYNALTSVDGNLLKMANVFKVSKWNIIRFVYMPSIRKPCLESMQNVIGLLVKVCIATEMLAYVMNGAGGLIQYNYINFEIAMMLGYTILSILLAFLFEGIFALIIKLTEVKKWR